jgi:hypothetical protein
MHPAGNVCGCAVPSRVGCGVKRNRIRRRSRLRNEATLSHSNPSRVSTRYVPVCLAVERISFSSFFNHALHHPFSQQPASGLILSRVALCGTASAQLDAAPSHH